MWIDGWGMEGGGGGINVKGGRKVWYGDGSRSLFGILESDLIVSKVLCMVEQNRTEQNRKKMELSHHGWMDGWA